MPSVVDARVSFMLALPHLTSPTCASVSYSTFNAAARCATTSFLSESVAFVGRKIVIPKSCRNYQQDLRDWVDTYGTDYDALPWEAVSRANASTVNAVVKGVKNLNPSKTMVPRRMRSVNDDNANTQWDTVSRHKSATV